MLEQIALKNFFVFKDVKVEFSPTPGLTLVTGEIDGNRQANNGAGKSLLFESIWFAIFGSLARGTKGSVFTQVRFQGLEVVRRHVSTWELIVNGQRYDTAKEVTKALLRDLFNTDEKSVAELIFAASSFFGSRFPLWFTQTPKQATELFEQLLFLHRLKEKEEQALEFVKDAKKKKVELEKVVQKIHEEIQAFEKNLEEAKKAKEQELEALRRERDLYQQQLLETKAKIQYVKDKITEVEDFLSDLHSILQNRQSSVYALTNKLRDLEATKQRILSLQGTCPTCLQPISEEHKDHCLAVVEKDIKELTIALRAEETELKALQEEEKKVREILKGLQKELSSLQEEYSRLTAYIAQLEGRISKIEETPISDHLNKHFKEILRTNEEQLKELTKQEEVFSFVAQRLREARFSLLEDALRFLQESANAILAQTNFVGQISIEPFKRLKSGEVRPNITFKVLRDGAEVPFQALSDGEQQLTKFAVWRATSDLVRGLFPHLPRFCVLDEPLQGLDENHRDIMFELIAQLGQENQVFVIDHDAQFKERFNNFIIVSRQGDQATVYWEE